MVCQNLLDALTVIVAAAAAAAAVSPTIPLQSSCQRFALHYSPGRTPRFGVIVVHSFRRVGHVPRGNKTTRSTVLAVILGEESPFFAAAVTNARSFGSFGDENLLHTIQPRPCKGPTSTHLAGLVVCWKLYFVLIN